ncbi:MAG: trypsin-like peptidase domain-containing protein [Muriicola sp.]|nr:trypsin-like peptidase domain-containing protein [Muriicola sp.]MBT8283085.1 trypsin-like peptidase domain-containing protein [Muriicola sp.]NNK11414.1 PDZ domain-containing protein [Flavobacteriaceae bacterium]
MRRFSSLLMVAIFGGAITLGGYKLFIEKNNSDLAFTDSDMPVFRTSTTPTSSAGAGIDAVDFTTAAENTVNAVVHVKNLTLSKASGFFDFFYGSEARQVPQVGTGSGVIISPDGYIVTNNHVIAKSKELKVTLNNNKTYDAELIGTDPNSDIALIKIEADRPLPYLAFGDSDNTKVGEWVLAVGNPFNLTSTVTAGIVSAKARALGSSEQSFIQTDAAVNPGNSGGALVNTNGDLIGINTAITSQTGSYVGYSFAVPSNIAKKIIEDILEYGNVQKGMLGISAPRVNTPYAIENGINEIEGVYVGNVEEESGADDAGLQTGDIIKQIDDIKIRRFADLTGYISTKRPGDEVQVTVKRDDDIMLLPVTLKERQSLIVPVMGLVVKNLTEKDKKVFKIEEGVKITGIPETYRRDGLELEGSVILEIDGEPINNIQDARIEFGKITRYGKTVITLLNKDGERERVIFQ